MSTYRINRISFGTTGVKSFNVGFAVAGYRITLSKIFTGTEGFSHKSVGGSNGINQYCNSFIQDHLAGFTYDFADRVVHHMTMGTNSFTPAVIANHDSMTATGFTINVTQASANYQWTVEYWD